MTVTEQTEAWPCGALTHDPTISVEENRFLFTESYFRGAESAPAQSHPLPQDPVLLMLPKRLQAKTMPRGSPYPYLFLSQLYKQVSIPSGMCT